MPLYLPTEDEIQNLRRASYPRDIFQTSVSQGSIGTGSSQACRCQHDVISISRAVNGVTTLRAECKEQFAMMDAMIVNERRRRYNERATELCSLKPLVKEKPGSGYELASKTLGIETSAMSPPLEPGPKIGDEYPAGRYPDLRTLSLADLARLICFYNDSFGIGTEDWGKEAFLRRYVEWLRT